MNKYKEALDTIVDLYEYLYINKLHESGNHIDDLKEYWTLNELVEKSISKKPYFESDGYADGYPVYDTWLCPRCGHDYEVDSDKFDYCPHCGQRIDWEEQLGTIGKLLDGDVKAFPKPWKPEKGEKYWFYLYGTKQIISSRWCDGNYDLLLWKVGNCFKNKEEAITKGKEIMEQIQKEYEEA